MVAGWQSVGSDVLGISQALDANLGPESGGDSRGKKMKGEEREHERAGV